MFHIGNALQPRSIFDDPNYLPDCFRDLMRRAESEHGATELMTETWLNSHPLFQALFPPVYLERMTPARDDVGYTANHWGQFINARGTFHRRNAEAFGRTGRLPYPSRGSWCTVGEMRAHLDARGG